MESLRLISEEVPLQLQKMDSFMASFDQSLDSIKGRVQETLQNQGTLVKLKSTLREAEDEFVKVLAVKTRKEAKQIAIGDSMSATGVRIGELEKAVQAQKARRDEYAAIMSQQSLEKGGQDVKDNGEIQEAMLWYNKVLGFRVEGGRGNHIGVKFTFNYINKEKPYEEYTFTVRHENETYTLLGCDPHLNDTKELMNELNRTNGLFKFVRLMREKFQEAASLGILPRSTSLQETATISASAPGFSVSISGSECLGKENEYSSETQPKKVNLRKGDKQGIPSPRSVRRSPRLIKHKH
ncbi:kinetochore protein SPC25 homolog isoform X1 [Euphorbia lathyris]|uniref:kinetochore protein SPC25 homolog isoform X1 n=1 Tax=Euphorbia lathyris TaxID=212925 RepID=UPI00331426CF